MFFEPGPGGSGGPREAPRAVRGPSRCLRRPPGSPRDLKQAKSKKPKNLNEFTERFSRRHHRMEGTSHRWGWRVRGCLLRGPRPGRSTNVRTYVGPGVPVQQGSREINKYTHPCGARGLRTTGTSGGQQIFALMWGLWWPRTTGIPGGQPIYALM